MLVKVLFALSTCMIMADMAWGQKPEPRVELDRATFSREVAKSEDFSHLSDLREDLGRQILEAEQEVQQLTDQLNSMGSLPLLQRFLEEKQNQLEAAKKAKPVVPDYIETLGNIIARTQGEIATYNDTSTALKDAKKSLSELMRNRSLVEHRIVTLLREAKDAGTFRWVTSVSFCVLVLFVIAGFYIIAWYKEQIAYTIFAGEKGMQFITLFLIVIAIILFGIMGTLEGKELAALLGGLSGYILGRTSTVGSQGVEQSSARQRAQVAGTEGA